MAMLVIFIENTKMFLDLCLLGFPLQFYLAVLTNPDFITFPQFYRWRIDSWRLSFWISTLQLVFFSW